MFRMMCLILTLLQKIRTLVVILIVKHSSNQDMVRILIVYYQCFFNCLLLVNIDNTEEHPNSNTDDKIPPSPGHG